MTSSQEKSDRPLAFNVKPSYARRQGQRELNRQTNMRGSEGWPG